MFHFDSCLWRVMFVSVQDARVRGTERGAASGNAPVSGGTACSLLSACFFLGLHLEPEDGGNIFLRYILHYHRTTRRYITEYKTLHGFHKLYSLSNVCG
jgi:hypothetical protein